MRRRAGVALIVALLGCGIWLLGDGLWIYAKAQLAQHLLQRAWARTLAGESAVKPWPWADTWPVARLRVPAHGADLIVLDGVSGRTLAFGPGHMPGTPRPGRAGVAVIAGHRDTHFRFLRDVRAGDEIVVEAPGRLGARFRVRERAVVDARTAILAGADDARDLVLVTCYPFDALRPGGPLRYLVLAEAELRPPPLGPQPPGRRTLFPRTESSPGVSIHEDPGRSVKHIDISGGFRRQLDRPVCLSRHFLRRSASGGSRRAFGSCF